MGGKFVWRDLSTFDVGKAQRFYATLFGWHFPAVGADVEGYHIARLGRADAAAVFEMPAALRRLNLPSFWMSYVQVDDVAATVRLAETLPGTIVEVAPEPFGRDAVIALVRDPSGAGFTLYQGPRLGGYGDGGHGQQIWTVHHLDDIGRITGFYETLFGWRFAARPGMAGVHDIHTAEGVVIGTVEELEEDDRGPFRYWMPVFAVTDVARAAGQSGELGGGVLWQGEDGRAILSDDQGAGFMIAASRAPFGREQVFSEQ